MLRTHGELGYRQEQRFHLELGLLKMAHAQRLLPLEQLLSQAASGAGQVQPRSAPGPVLTSPEMRRTAPATQARSNSVSPFAADSARKGGPRSDSSSEAVVALTPTPAYAVVMGSAAPAFGESPQSISRPVSPGISEQVSQPSGEACATAVLVTCESLRDAVLSAVGNQPTLLSLLETAEWRLEGSTLTAKAAVSSTLIEMSFTAEARRAAGVAGGKVAGRPIKVQVEPVQVEPGSSPQASVAARPAAKGSARSRAEEDPIVQRMKEKFGAEIRTVIDYRERG